jgi:hypothetical protein
MKAGQRAYALPILLFLVSFAYWIGGAACVYDDMGFGPKRACRSILVS